jgi:hypothetical protein
VFGLLGTSVGGGITILAPPSVGGDAADYYVATSGSDSNDGTEGSPFLTLDKCYDTMTAGQTCEVDGGTYTGSQSITGTQSSTVTIRAAAGETVTISGYTQLDSGSAGGNDSITFSGASNTVAVDGTGTGTAGYTVTASGSCSGGVECNKLTIGNALLDCPTANRTGSGWTGCTLTSCGSASPCKWYDGAEIRSTGTALAISGADHLTLDGLTAFGMVLTSDGSTKATNLTLTDMRVYAMSVNDVDTVTLTGSTLGGSTVADVNIDLQTSSGALCCATNVTIEDNDFVGTDRRDCGDTVNSVCHTECIFLRNGDAAGTSNISIKRNTFTGCADFGIFMENNVGNPGPITNLTIEGNAFDRVLETPGGCGVGDGCTPVKASDNAVNIKGAVGLTLDTFSISFNSFAGSFGIGVGGTEGSSSATLTAGTVRGNIGWHGVITSGNGMHICNRANVTCTYNFWGNSASVNVCPGTNETNATCAVTLANIFENEITAVDVAPDLHLQASPSPDPRGYVPSGCPTLDIDGAARPATNCDAGADEV